MSPLSLILMTALSWNDPAASDGMVYDFSATWCGPCQQMSPMVSRLAREGYPIQKVDVDQYREFAQHYRIEKMPTFVVVVRGKEVSRVVGKVTEDDLMRMFEQIPRKAPPTVAAPRAVTINTRTPTVRAKLANEPAPIKRLELSSPMAASTRIRIRDKNGENYGSGTIIDSRPGNTIVLTCGHIFRNLDETSIIEVDVFTTSGKPEMFVGKLLKFDIEAEVGLVSIATDNPLPACRVAGPGYKIAKAQKVESIGCGRGDPPTSHNIAITSLNRYLGPDNIECNGIPVQGRSGGGLFSTEGFVIGVCMAADQKGNRGLYSGLQPIHDLLDKCQLSRVYRPETDALAGKSASLTNSEADTAADLEASFTTADLEVALRDARPADATVATSGAAKGRTTAALVKASASVPEVESAAGSSSDSDAKLAQGADSAEVVCVIRPIKNPRGASKVVVINRASTKFMNYLTDEMQSQSEVKPTSYAVRTASAREPSARSTSGAYRRSRALSW